MNAAAFAPDGKSLLTICGGVATRWDSTTGKSLATANVDSNLYFGEIVFDEHGQPYFLNYPLADQTASFEAVGL